VFDQYDTSRRGTLGVRDLARLVRDVTPQATDAQIKYFLVRYRLSTAPVVMLRFGFVWGTAILT
jgi:hypothetical protein